MSDRLVWLGLSNCRHGAALAQLYLSILSVCPLVKLPPLCAHFVSFALFVLASICLLAENPLPHFALCMVAKRLVLTHFRL